MKALENTQSSEELPEYPTKGKPRGFSQTEEKCSQVDARRNIKGKNSPMIMYGKMKILLYKRPQTFYHCIVSEDNKSTSNTSPW